MNGKSTLLSTAVMGWGASLVAQIAPPDLDQAYREGRVIFADQGPLQVREEGGLTAEGPLECGTPVYADGHFRFSTADAWFSVLEVQRLFDGSAVGFFSDAGAFQGGLLSDGDPGGGMTLDLGRNDSSLGFYVDGNFLGTESARLSVIGPAQTILFDTSVTGNASAVLPDEAINRDEILDEPGVATNSDSQAMILSGGVQTLLSRSLVAPADGYVFAIGTASTHVFHVDPVVDTANFGVSDTPGVFPSNQDVALSRGSGTPTGDYNLPITVHGLFEVDAGVHTFYFLGQYLAGTWPGVSNRQLTLIYVPTQYGAVDSALAESSDLDVATELAISRSNLGTAGTAADISHAISDEQREERRRFREALERRERELIRSLDEQRRRIGEFLGQWR